MSGKKEITIEWRCDVKTVSKTEQEWIEIVAANITKSYAKGGDLVRIRFAMHPNTKRTVFDPGPGRGKTWTMVPDKNGNHFTAEFEHSNGRWYTFHYYCRKQQGPRGVTWVKKELGPDLPENPEVYWRSATSTSCSQSMRVFKIRKILV